jgi:thiamine transport system substrate-binding protein
MCFRQIEFAGILAGTENEELAQAFIDFMLSVPVQESLPLQMFVFPVHEDAELPDLFAEHAQIPDNPVVMPPERIEANRDAWISTWLETVTR